jgi:hypothetical protein
MFEHCKYYKCVYNGNGDHCSFLNDECDRKIKDKRCVHSGMYLKCAFAAYDDEILRCCFDVVSRKEIKNLPPEDYRKSPSIKNLRACLKEILKEKKPEKYSDDEPFWSRFDFGELKN